MGGLHVKFLAGANGHVRNSLVYDKALSFPKPHYQMPTAISSLSAILYFAHPTLDQKWEKYDMEEEGEHLFQATAPNRASQKWCQKII
jgi:hypothetical protein